MSTPEIDERVRRAVDGDRAAMHSLLAEIGPTVLRTTRALLGADAPEVDDVAQDALMEIVRALAGFRGESSLRHYANRITVRTALRARRRASKERARRDAQFEADANPASPDVDPQLQLAARRRADHLRSLLTELPGAQAEALTLRLVLGYDLPEISAATGATLNTVRSRVRLGREKLRALIEADPSARSILEAEA
jgi:RNA polymerase sigma-70 factor (ECF subfamily)